MVVGFGLALPLLLGEIILRFLPVYSGMKLMPLNAANPILRFTPNQDVTWSEGWNFFLINQLHINNDGFVNNQDYDASARTPLFAVVGDSYIEAAMVPYAETVQGRLQQVAGSRARVYSFGKSGAPFSEYLVWADHARQAYHPNALMISIVGNDFDESLNRYKTMQAGHYYVDNSAGELELRQFDYQPTLFRRILRESALVRYLTWHLHAEAIFSRASSRDEQFVGNTSSHKSDKVVADSKRAVDAFFRDLPAKSGLPPNRVLLSVDAMRPDLYNPQSLAAAQGSYFDLMRRYFIDQAKAKGYEVIDLQEIFLADFQKNHRRFEFPQDNHWSSYGHSILANAVQNSAVFQSVLGK
jgi:hypothetical protein